MAKPATPSLTSRRPPAHRACVAAALLLVVLASPVVGAPTRSSPLGVAADGRVLVVNPDAGTVARLRFEAAAAGTVAGSLEQERPVGAYPRTLALAGAWVFTADQKSDTVTRRRQDDLDAGVATHDLGFGCAPYGIAPLPDGSAVVVACQGTSELVVLDLELAETARVRLDWPNARALALSDAGEAYVTHYLTEEPASDGHVSVVDLAHARVARVLAIPPDTTTCETQNSGQGVYNLLSAIALMPDDAPDAVRGQVWVGGTLENVLSKGLFKRHAAFADDPGSALFPWVGFAPFPASGTSRNVYKSSFHDITRFGLVKLDRRSGAVVGKIDIDEANNATDIELSSDGAVAYVVDQMFNSYHVFNTARGQGGNPTTLFAAPSAKGPGGANPDEGCVPEALRSVTGEAPFRMAPQAQITVLDPNPVRPNDDPARPYVPVSTGVEFDAGHHLETGANRMLAVPDGIGTAPIGVRLAADGGRAYVLNYLARNVVAAGTAGAAGRLRCTNAPDTACGTSSDCGASAGFCNHPGGASCTADADCGANGPCVQSAQCVPLLLSDPVVTVEGGAGRCSVPAEQPCTRSDECGEEPGFCNHDGTACADDDTCGPPPHCVAQPCANGAGTCPVCDSDGADCTTDGDCVRDHACVVRSACVVLAADALDASLLDGKILFNTAARDASTTNGIGLRAAAPLFNDRVRARRIPGSVVSTSHDASYVTCSTCHADYGGQDGRTWDFAQFGASLRNTMDLRGRPLFAPGHCSHDAGVRCFFDAACGPGNTCRMDDALVPPNITAPEDRARYFNPMLTVHWNGDRDEVEDFEHTYRSLLGAGDCDGAESSDACQGGLIQRSRRTSADPADVPADLGRPSRNVRGAGGADAGVRLTHVADFVYSLTDFPRNPNRGDAAAAERGRAIFDDPSTQCASCHNGPAPGRQLFTDKRPNGGFDAAQDGRADRNNPFVRHDVGTANLFDQADPHAVAEANQTWQLPGVIPASRGPLGDYLTPVLNDVWNTAPYLHDGSAHALLDVVRPCDTAVDDCDRAGAGRNRRIGGVEQHGATSFLTPRQLEDLVAFMQALSLDTRVGTNVRAVSAGRLMLERVALRLPRTTKRGRRTAGLLRVRATLSGAALDASGGLTLSLATPAGAHLATIERMLAMTGAERRLRGRASEGEVTTRLALRRRGDGWRVTLVAKGPGLAVLDTGTPDLTVALEAGGTQFVHNRQLVGKKRVLRLPGRRG